MTRVVTLPTKHQELGKALDSLAPYVRESSLHFAAPEAATNGEWVRFRWTLADGSIFFEGVGKCAASHRNAAGRFDLLLKELTFDARNEAMFERILLANEDRHTGPQAVARPESPPPIAAVPRRYSSAPPPPMNPAPVPTRPPTRKPPPPPTGKLSNVLKGALKPKPSSMPPPAATPNAPVPVASDLLEHARELARRLNLSAPALARGRWTEERVLRAALRMGLQSFEGLLAHKDSDQ